MNRRAKGYFNYYLEDGSFSEKISFEIEFCFSDNHSFTGKGTDEEYSTICNLPFEIKGFVEDEVVSFTKTYPYAYTIDESHQLILLQEQKNHVVHYMGEAKNNKWTGYWEVVKFGLNEDTFITGNWEFEIHE